MRRFLAVSILLCVAVLTVFASVAGADTFDNVLKRWTKDKKYVDRILAIVLRYGNFGKYGRKEQQGGWKHSIETGLRSIRHITQFFWLSPSENFLILPKLISNSLKKNIATD